MTTRTSPLRWIARWVVAAVVIALVVGHFVARTDDGQPHDRPDAQARVGTLYGITDTSSPRDPAGSAIVRVPDGAARVTVFTRTDEASTRVDPTDGGTDDPVREPSDGSLFTVTAAPLATVTGLHSIVSRARTGSSAQYELVLDGRRYPLGATARRSGFGFSTVDDALGVAVGVRGHPREVELRATFAGVTQTFDLTRHRQDLGRAALLYRSTATHSRACGAVEDSRSYPAVPGATAARCRVQLQPAPWTAGTGWAPAGRIWPVVSVQVSPVSLVRAPRGTRLAADTLYDSTVDVQVGDQRFDELDDPASIGTRDTGVRTFVGPVAVLPGASQAVTIDASWRLAEVTLPVEGDRYVSREDLSWTVTLA